MKKQLKHLFGLDKLYEAKHWPAFLIDSLFVILIVGTFRQLIYMFRSDILIHVWFWTVIYVPIGFYYLRKVLQAIYTWDIVRNRDYINNSSSQYVTAGYVDTAIIQLLSDKRYVKHSHMIALDEHSALYDIEFNIYRRTKHGEYKSKEMNYTIFEMRLQRVVPHLIFDSKSAKGNQFRYNYLQSQRISFEGNVDNYFEAYAPETYHIDTLSFITPEVLIELVNLHDYDIEFKDDRMLCYAPLLPNNELNDFKTKCINLYNSVNNNLDTYRDDRLLGQDRINNVTNFSRQLLLSPLKYVPLFILSGIGTLGLIYFCAIYGWQYLFNGASIFVWVLFITCGYKIIKILKDNRRAEQEFLRQKEMPRLNQNNINFTKPSS